MQEDEEIEAKKSEDKRKGKIIFRLKSIELSIFYTYLFGLHAIVF